ncbi:M23 family metallopeptidase [Microbacterium sp. KUDC0406]|uniref:murein hydrolase activator EnvC family protein n=1 Tax=Microbacterium sp. KUDC0406 TaxID=2909588 RepID=UPI001F38A2F1|nr:M23 family metallopeptidase [Microbacterium sp. KUDC0406]UJP11170.1 M23 family metallopeptidase [Microbacterium sp. KUDC0406]
MDIALDRPVAGSGLRGTAHRGSGTPRAARAGLILLLALSSLCWPFPQPVAAGGDLPVEHGVALPADAPWVWPVDGAREVTAPFRAPAHRYGPGHRGMDITATGPIRAPASGVVAFRGIVADRGVLTIDHGDGYVITLEPVSSDLAPGDAVEAGQLVATASAGGHAARGTVHVGVRLDDEYVNPRPLFGDVPRAILYPCCDDG